MKQQKMLLQSKKLVKSSVLTFNANFQGMSPLNFPYTVAAPSETCCVVPVLRSGLQMVPSFLTLLPSDTTVHHLGLFRDKHTLQPVEYYNKLPPPQDDKHIDIAFVVDPIIATGGTASTVVAILKEWGVKKIIFTAILASTEGIKRAAGEWPEGYFPFSFLDANRLMHLGLRFMLEKSTRNSTGKDIYCPGIYIILEFC